MSLHDAAAGRNVSIRRPFSGSLVRKAVSDRNIRKSVGLFLILKFLVIAVAIAATFLIPAELTGRQSVLSDPVLNAFAQYDARAYLDVAANGYNHAFLDGLGNLHFYPLYPLLIIAFSFLGFGLSAFLVSNFFSFASVVVLYLLVRDELGPSHAFRSVALLLLFPTAFYMTMMYTESLFLFLSIMTFYYARKESWFASSAFGFLASLTRIQGFLLFFPIFWMYLSSRQVSRKDIMSLALIRKLGKRSILFISFFLGPLLLSIYHFFAFGNFFAQSGSVAVWGKSLSAPWAGFLQAVYAFADTSLINVSYHLFNIFMIAFFLVILFYSWKLLKKEYFIYMLVSFVIILFGPNLFGFLRYALVLFPMYMTMSLLWEKSSRWKYALAALYAVFIIVMLASIVMHVNERVHVGLLFDPLV